MRSEVAGQLKKRVSLFFFQSQGIDTLQGTTYRIWGYLGMGGIGNGISKTKSPQKAERKERADRTGPEVGICSAVCAPGKFIP